MPRRYLRKVISAIVAETRLTSSPFKLCDLCVLCGEFDFAHGANGVLIAHHPITGH